MRAIDLKGKEDTTRVVVDVEGSCERANHAGRWHLVWETNDLGYQVRVMRMCPREADRVEELREGRREGRSNPARFDE